MRTVMSCRFIQAPPFRRPTGFCIGRAEAPKAVTIGTTAVQYQDGRIDDGTAHETALRIRGRTPADESGAGELGGRGALTTTTDLDA